MGRGFYMPFPVILLKLNKGFSCMTEIPGQYHVKII